jgi:hypothetical protein
VTEPAPDLELLARLRAADPASSLPPADAARVADLLEAAMTESATRSRESRETGTRARSALTWLVAAAAVVLIAAGIFGLAHRDHGSSPVVEGSVTQLGYAAPAGRCMTPNVGVLKAQTVAFRGTLISVVDGTATFDVTRWYAGGPTDLAKVTAAPPALHELTQAAHLETGGAYLVAAAEGRVLGCGFTGPAKEPLLKLYDRAFG